MAAQSGRNLLLQPSQSPIATLAGVMSKSFAIANEVIDITSDDDEGFRSYLAEAANRAIDISVEGVTKDSVLIQAALDGSDLDLDMIITMPGIGTITGLFTITALSITGETKDAMKFSASLNSNGEYTFTLASPHI